MKFYCIRYDLVFFITPHISLYWGGSLITVEIGWLRGAVGVVFTNKELQ